MLLFGFEISQSKRAQNTTLGGLISAWRGVLLRGRLQRTSAKISYFQTTPSPCPGVSEFPKPLPLPGRPRPDFSIFQFLHIFIFAYLNKVDCPIPVFIKFKMLNTITFRE